MILEHPFGYLQEPWNQSPQIQVNNDLEMLYVFVLEALVSSQHHPLWICEGLNLISHVEILRLKQYLKDTTNQCLKLPRNKAGG